MFLKKSMSFQNWGNYSCFLPVNCHEFLRKIRKWLHTLLSKAKEPSLYRGRKDEFMPFLRTFVQKWLQQTSQELSHKIIHKPSHNVMNWFSFCGCRWWVKDNKTFVAGAFAFHDITLNCMVCEPTADILGMQFRIWNSS